MANHSPYEYNYYVPSAEHGSGDDEDEKDKKSLKKKTSAIASVTGHISLNDSGKGGEISLRAAKGEGKAIKPIGLFSKDFELKKPTAEAKATAHKEDDDDKKPVAAPVYPAAQLPPMPEQPFPLPTAESPYLQPLGPEDFMHSYPQAETHILPAAKAESQEEADEADDSYSPTAQPPQAWPHPVIPPAYRTELQMPVFPPAEGTPTEPAQTAEQLYTIDEDNETQPLVPARQPEAFAAPLPQTAEWQPVQPKPEDNNTVPAGAGGNHGHGGYHGGNGSGPTNNGRPMPVPPQPSGHNNGNFGGGIPPSSPNNASSYTMPPSPNQGYGNYLPLPGPTETRIEPAPQPTVIEREVVTNNLDPTVPFLAAAGAVGFVAERHFRRKGDEKVAKAAAAQNKKLQQQINTLQANQLRANQQPTPAYNPNAVPPAHQAQPNQYPGYNHNQQQPNVAPNPNTAPTPAPVRPVRSAERPAPFGTAEAVGSGFAAARTFGERPSQPMAPGEKTPQQQSAEQANIEAANEANQDVREEDIRKVRDAWLETHVNKNTGQVIERDYGQAYHQERRAEQFPGATNASGDSNSHTSAQQQGLGAGAPVYAPMPQTSQPEPMLTAGSVNPSLPRPHQEPMLPQGAPRQIDPQHRLPRPHNPIVSNLTNPWFWLILGLLVIAYFGRSAL